MKAAYRNGHLRDAIIELLEMQGDMTAAQLAVRLPAHTGESIRRVCRAQVLQGRIHVEGWTWCDSGARSYPRPIYSPGSGVNARKPRATPRVSKRTTARVARSVFDLARTL